MSETNFNVGDIVKLKSGSPDMTVSYSDKDETYVFYYNYDKQSVSSKITLPTGVLEIV